MFDTNEIYPLTDRKSFSFSDFFAASRSSGCQLGEASMRKRLQSMLKSGEVVRVGRNAYCVCQKNLLRYQYEYSKLAKKVAKIVQNDYPTLEFSLFELIQLNEFVNHQLANNTIFLSVEEDIMDFVFGTMKEHFPGKVLLDPTPEFYHQYWYEDMVVINKLVTEAPKGHEQPWHMRIEKLLVDLISDRILMESFSESEYPTILEDAFDKYVIDESCLFRYAKRRVAEKKIKAIIHDNTEIVLRTE